MFVKKTIRCRVTEPVRVRTTDAVTRDTLIDTPTAAEMLRYCQSLAKMDPGLVWDGNMREAKGVLDRLTSRELCDTLEGLAKYSTQRSDAIGSGPNLESSEATPGPNESLTFSGAVTRDRAARVALRETAQATARIAKMQEANNRFWNPTKPAA
jgi:hypothetical protein